MAPYAVPADPHVDGCPGAGSCSVIWNCVSETPGWRNPWKSCAVIVPPASRSSLLLTGELQLPWTMYCGMFLYSGHALMAVRKLGTKQLPKSVKEQVIERKVQELPLLGRIAAGRPLEAVEERETISLGDFARGGNSFVLQVKGSSMIEDHIMDGDFVVCEQTQLANAGDIVVALVGGEEATLKRFYREGSGKVRLQPANSEMAPIMVAAADVKIQGRVIGVLRKY